jgi:hypothetical protein
MEATMPGIDEALKQAAIDAAKSATFRPETIAGHGVAGTVAVPFCFSIKESDEHCYQKSLGKTEIMATRSMPLTSVVSIDPNANRQP